MIILHLNKSYYDPSRNAWIGIVYDNDKKKSFLKIVDNPHVTAYITKEIPSYIREYVFKKDCTEVSVPYRGREFALADKLQLSNFREDVKNKKYKKELVYLHPALYGADFTLEDEYLLKFVKDEEKRVREAGVKENCYDNITQAFLDIETDVPMSPSDRAGQAIYMITTYYDDSNEMYLDFLIDPKYKGYEVMTGSDGETLMDNKAFLNTSRGVSFNEDPHVKNWISKIKDNFLKEITHNEKFMSMSISDTFIELVKNCTYHVIGYTNEKDLIRETWHRAMRVKKPNYLQIYNANFDVSCCYMRYTRLGGDPKDLFTDPAIGEWFNLYCEDVRKFEGTYRPPKKREIHPCNEPQYYDTPTVTSIQDTAVLYYSFTAKKENSYSLEATTQRELNFGKLDYSSAGLNIFNLPYVDFTLAAEYCIRDTMILKPLDMKTTRMMNTLIKRNMMCTEFDRLHVSMDYCTNVFNVDMYDAGEVQRNAINKYLLKHDRATFERLQNPLWLNLYDAVSAEGGITGGFVANPNKLRVEGKELIRGVRNSKYVKRVVDLDARAHYPSAIAANNIGLESLIGQITHIEPSSETLNNPSKRWLDICNNPHKISMKLINRDIVGIGELFNLHSMEEMLEMHYGISCDWNETPPDRIVLARMRPDGSAYVKYIKKIFNDKYNKIDKEAEKESFNGYVPLSTTGNVSVRYYGTLVNIKTTMNGKPVNTCKLVIEDYDSETEIALTTFKNIKLDNSNTIDHVQAIINRNHSFSEFMTPRKEFQENRMALVEKRVVSFEEIQNIMNHKDYTYKFECGKYIVTLTNRLLALPVDKDAEYFVEVYSDSGDISFKLISKSNIKLNKDECCDIEVNQIISVLMI